MDLAQWWAEEACREHYAPKGAQCHSGDELEVFHRIWKLDRFAVGPFVTLTERPFASLTEGSMSLSAPLVRSLRA